MPVYEYQCTACHQEFEYQQRMSDPDKTTCEVCGGPLERLISRTAFAFKGSGWYKDLYSSAKPAEAKTESGGDAAAPAKEKDAAPAKSDSATSSTPVATPSSGSGTSGTDKKGGGSTTSAAAAAKAS